MLSLSSCHKAQALGCACCSSKKHCCSPHAGQRRADAASEPDCAHILDQHVNNLHSTAQHDRAQRKDEHTTCVVRCDEPASNAAGYHAPKPRVFAYALRPQKTCRQLSCSSHAAAAGGRCRPHPSPASCAPPTRFFFDVTSPCTCEMLVSVSLVSLSIVLAAPEELCMQEEQQQRHSGGCSPPSPCTEAALAGGAHATRHDTTPAGCCLGERCSGH